MKRCRIAQCPLVHKIIHIVHERLLIHTPYNQNYKSVPKISENVLRVGFLNGKAFSKFIDIGHKPISKLQLLVA